MDQEFEGGTMTLQMLYDNRTAGVYIDNDTGELWFFFSFYKNRFPLFRMNMTFDMAKEYADISKQVLGDISPADTFGGRSKE